MGKIVFWIVVFFVVLLALRLVNVAASRKRNAPPADDPGAGRRRELPAEPTVRCATCGTYLPKAEARPAADGYTCGDPACPRRR